MSISRSWIYPQSKRIYPRKGGVIPTPLELAQFAGRLAVGKKAADTIIIDLEERVSYCDYFVICSAKNRRQSKSIASAIKSAMRDEFGTGPISIEGMESGRWVLIDLGDVVVHVFDEPLRPFYNLEGLWCDAPKVELDLPEGMVSEKGSLFTP